MFPVVGPDKIHSEIFDALIPKEQLGDFVTSEEHTIPGVTCQALYSPLFMDNFHHFLNLSTFLFMYITEIA